jgi:ubiquinone/menaquinone biosynthesis C-methylase UbiE
LTSWREFSHCTVPVVRARVEDIVRRVSGPKVLEVGCNEGWVAKAINEERGFEVTAVDNRDLAIAQCKNYFGINAIKASALDLPFGDATFDCVVMGELLEHLENPGKGLAEAFRVSKGHVIATLPIGRYWNGELSHAWQINGSMIEHDEGKRLDFLKHSFVVEFRQIRRIENGFNYVDLNEGHEDR